MAITYRIAGIVLAFWFLCIQVSHAIPASQTNPSPAELTVIASSSDVPVQGAVVLLEHRSGSHRLSVTGRDGLCRFKGLEPGDYSLQILLRSYFVAPEVEGELAHLEIAPGQKQSVKVSMVKGGVVTGRVLNPDGLSINGVPLTALKVNTASGATVLPSLKESNVTALSDDRGEFRIYGLRPGRYAIAVNAQRNLFPLRSAATFYYPAQREVVNARLFDVFADQETKALDMIIDLDGGTQNTLSGRVVGPHLAPLEGVFLSLQQITGGYVSDVCSSDREGYFGFEGLPSGKYVVRAQARQGSYFSAEKEVTIKDFNNTEIVLELRPYVTVAGNVYLRNKTQINSLSLNMRLASSKAGGSIDFASVKNGGFSAKSGRDGPFWWSFPGLARENYLEKITSGGRDITHKPLNLNQTLSLDNISIQVAAGAATLGGRFRDEDRSVCLRYTVYAVAMRTKRNEILFVKRADSCNTDSFRIYSLSPGPYYVFALPIDGSDRDRSLRPRTRFESIDDYQFQLIKNAVDNFEETNKKPFVVDENRTYEDIVPIVLK
jgi:hypothetical protein